jgi:hypothetical protein
MVEGDRKQVRRGRINRHECATILRGMALSFDLTGRRTFVAGCTGPISPRYAAAIRLQKLAESQPWPRPVVF